jgi:hypothetical protein
MLNSGQGVRFCVLQERMAITLQHQGNRLSPRRQLVAPGPLALLVVLAAILCLPRPAWAQISPGPLARPHESLNGALHCTDCHKFGSAATLKCLGCHTEIAGRLGAGRGLHATYKLPKGDDNACSKCHSEHNGEDFALIKWDIKTFDHNLTGYVLEGKHQGVACNKCHTAEHVSPAARAMIKIKNLARTFLGTPQACSTCHEDVHKGRLGADCLQCHNYIDWKTLAVKKLDHNKTRYPLTGQHISVKCEKCHTPGTDGKPRYTGIPFGKCADCHADVHHGSFPQPCEACHTTGGWKKISLVGVDKNFDHAKTKYPLLGKHAAVDCGACHKGGDFKKEIPFAKCTDCHLPDPHNGQFQKRPDGIECSSCHTVDTFKPSTFMAKDHDTTDYPLKGKHFTVACGKCHIDKGKATVYKIKFAECTDCHEDDHDGQFAGPPNLNKCEKCHTVADWKPSTFTLKRHKDTRLALTGGHIAVPCADCHKEPEHPDAKPKPVVFYHWKDLSCETCHQDPHKGQFAKDMKAPGPDGTPIGCEACHSAKNWKDLTRFDHSKTSFPLVGAHRATACIDCHKPPDMETQLVKADFTAAPSKCEACHDDVHGKQFEKDGVTSCVDCHNTMKWKPSLFDHDKSTKFPLQGLHQNVPCAGCHKDNRDFAGKKVLFYQHTPRECEDCHAPGTLPPNKAS